MRLGHKRIFDSLSQSTRVTHAPQSLKICEGRAREDVRQKISSYTHVCVLRTVKTHVFIRKYSTT